MRVTQAIAEAMKREGCEYIWAYPVNPIIEAGAEIAFGGIVQAFSESVPMVFLPAGMARAQAGYFPNFSSFLNYQHVTKAAEQLTNPNAVWDAMRRAFSQARNGRPGPT